MDEKTVEPKLDLNTATMRVPARQMPNFRTAVAVQNGVEKNLLFRTWGGLGDQICAEPTLRYALKTFKECDISLVSERPELFRHLKFKNVYDSKKVRPIYENYLVFDTITPPDESNLVWLFFSHMTTHCVDFASMCALRSQLPMADKELTLVGEHPGIIEVQDMFEKGVFIHAGRHWQSKTFPKEWWDQVLACVLAMGGTPILIGADTDDNRGTVDVNTFGCVDLRNKLSVSQTIWMLQRAKVLLTNDSAPLHMAASAAAWIGYVATVKHPDLITHWRGKQFGWRMKNFGKGGIWDIIDFCPNKDQEVTLENVGEENLKAWLPEPADFAEWAISKL